MPKYVDEILDQCELPFIDDHSKEKAVTLIQNNLNSRAKEMLIRYYASDKVGIKNCEYNSLLMEARELYFQQLHYSCVIMACAISERILRAIFFNKVQADGHHLEEKTKKHLSFLDAKAICEFLVSENIIEKKLLASFKILGELQTRYLNIMGKTPENDAERALRHLYKILRNVKLQVLV